MSRFIKYLSSLLAFLLLLSICIITSSFIDKETIVINTKKVSISNNSTIEVRQKTILEIADSMCQEIGVPYQLVYEIGKNESNWTFIKNNNGGSDFGDLQVIDPTFWYWYERLELEHGKTRRNYLKVGITYLKYLYDKYGSWEKARFAYGRGHWREPHTWTPLERKFMRKIDFSKYDSRQHSMYNKLN